jgi:hypothetical protein
MDAAEVRRQARATWAAGDWDSFSELIAPVGQPMPRICRSTTRACTASSRPSVRCSRPTTRGRRPSSCDGTARVAADYLLIAVDC